MPLGRDGEGGGSFLTDAGRQQARPVVVLLANAHRGADEPEAGVALVDHCVAVAEVLPDHLAVDDPLGDAAVTRCARRHTEEEGGDGERR